MEDHSDGESQDDTVGPAQQVGAGRRSELLAGRGQLLAQELMDAAVTDLVGAEPHQRTAGRTTYRNGYRDREWDTRVGTLELQIPKLRHGTFPSLLEPRSP